jgi:hypothetical protein
MTILANLVPHKHVLFSASLLAVAGVVRAHLEKEPTTLDELWVRMSKNAELSLVKPSFTEVILAVDLLFAVGQVDLNEFSQIQRTVS